VWATTLSLCSVLAITRMLSAASSAPLPHAALHRVCNVRRGCCGAGDCRRYAVGTNDRGQLGLGDLEPRDKFTVIRPTRGKRIDQLYAVRRGVFASCRARLHVDMCDDGGAASCCCTPLSPSVCLFGSASRHHHCCSIPLPITTAVLRSTILVQAETFCMALTVESDVYVWGGSGRAPLGLDDQGEEYKAGAPSHSRRSSRNSGNSSDDDSVDDDIYDSDEDKAVRAVLSRVIKYDAPPEGPVWMTPYYLEALRGEGVVQIAVGYVHVLCCGWVGGWVRGCGAACWAC